MTASLRRFQVGDAAACCEIINAAIETMDGLNAPARSLIVSKNVPEAVAADLVRCFTLVAVGSGGVEGPLRSLQGLGVLEGSEVKRVYVHPEFQSRGIGTQLVRALEAEARLRALPRIELQASPSSVRFYVGLGFRELVKEVSRNGDAEFTHVKMFKDFD